MTRNDTDSPGGSESVRRDAKRGRKGEESTGGVRGISGKEKQKRKSLTGETGLAALYW